MAEKFKFDEYFFEAFQQQLKLNEQQDEFTRKLAEEQRQNDFVNTYHQGVLGIQQGQENRLQEQQDINKQIVEYEITSGYQQVPLDMKGTLSGVELNKQFNDVLNPFEVNQYYLPKTETPKPIKGSNLVPMYEGKIEQNYEIDPITGEKRITGYGTLYRPFETTLNPPKDKDVNEKDVSGLIKDASTLLNDFKLSKGDVDTAMYKGGYNDWKSRASATTSALLNKVGLNKNSDILNYLRQVISEKDTPEQKRALLNAAFQDSEFRSKFPITKQQEEAIRYWIELDTR